MKNLQEMRTQMRDLSHCRRFLRSIPLLWHAPKNVDRHSDVGNADVCGKCLVAVPCSHTNPVARKLRG